jgi:hypothetical protein
VDMDFRHCLGRALAEQRGYIVNELAPPSSKVSNGFRCSGVKAGPQETIGRSASYGALRRPALKTCERCSLEPVSIDIRTGLCPRAGIPPGNGSAKPETAAAFLATPANSGRQRPRYPTSPSAKSRKGKVYCERARKPELCRTAWWWMHSAATSLHWKFPFITEFNREFREIWPSGLESEPGSPYLSDA